MTLSALIKKGGLEEVATATVATVATERPNDPGSVAKVAGVAVATPSRSKNTCIQLPAGNMACFLIVDGKDQELPLESLASKTLRALLGASYIFCFDLQEGRAYFTEDEEVFSRLQHEGKTVRWLHDLLEGWRKVLIACQGLPPGTSIYHWPLGEVAFWLEAHKVFPGARVLPGNNPFQEVAS